MSSVNVTLIQVLNNPAHFTEPFQFEITFECIEELSDDLEWRIIYVGSSESQQYDQLLDEVLVGPVPIGTNKFVFQADAPDPNRIPVEDLLGVTVVLLTCSYRKREFIRVGYYVNNEYEDQELRENPPAKPVIEKIVRNILAEKPRVTTFSIPWGNTTENEADIYVATMQQQQQQQYTYQAQQHPAGSSNVSDGMMEEEDLDANAEEDEQELDEEDEEDEEEDASMEDESMEEDDGEGESTADEATPAATTTSAAAAATTTASTGTDNMEA